MTQPPPRSESELLFRARALSGITLGELASSLEMPIPRTLKHHKGVVGDLIEAALGATASSLPKPDFLSLGIELKTIPLSSRGSPRESTHVCTVPMKQSFPALWQTSTVRAKLKRVLWMPVDASHEKTLPERRLGCAFLWSPSLEDEAILRTDWEELMELITFGQFERISARLGRHLQIRPKAANGRSLVASHNADGAPTEALPLGFYLRQSFTARILRQQEFVDG